MVGAVAGGAPLWVYGLLVVLVLLGLRRLRTRNLPIVVALLPVVAFLVWSLSGAFGLSKAAASVAWLAWLGGAAVGVASAFALCEPRATRLPGRRVNLPGSWMPLATYLTIFVARFACGAWAAINPVQAVTATAIGVAISAAAAVRLATGVLRWQSADAL